MTVLREVISGRLISRFVSAMFSGQLALQISQPMILLLGLPEESIIRLQTRNAVLRVRNRQEIEKNYTTIAE